MKMMQSNWTRIATIVLAMILVLGLAACGEQVATPENDTPVIGDEGAQSKNPEVTDNGGTIDSGDDSQQSTDDPPSDDIDIESWPGFPDFGYGVELPDDENAFE